MEIKEAVRHAVAFAESLGIERTETIRLEEVESAKVDRKPVWRITLSTVPLAANPNMTSTMADAIWGDTKRRYKVFTVDKNSGEVLSMKIRELAGQTM